MKAMSRKRYEKLIALKPSAAFPLMQPSKGHLAFVMFVRFEPDCASK